MKFEQFMSIKDMFNLIRNQREKNEMSLCIHTGARTHIHNRNEYLCPSKDIYKNIYVSQKLKTHMLIYNEEDKLWYSHIVEYYTTMKRTTATQHE